MRVARTKVFKGTHGVTVSDSAVPVDILGGAFAVFLFFFVLSCRNKLVFLVVVRRNTRSGLNKSGTCYSTNQKLFSSPRRTAEKPAADGYTTPVTVTPATVTTKPVTVMPLTVTPPTVTPKPLTHKTPPSRRFKSLKTSPTPSSTQPRFFDPPRGLPPFPYTNNTHNTNQEGKRFDTRPRAHKTPPPPPPSTMTGTTESSTPQPFTLSVCHPPPPPIHTANPQRKP